ncbi:hypothetical protein AWV63_23420 [Micromonospora rifamycinica]|nr:hypothetical protein AWV63_23420 [Micromonospora rifamycinica]
MSYRIGVGSVAATGPTDGAAAPGAGPANVGATAVGGSDGPSVAVPGGGMVTIAEAGFTVSNGRPGRAGYPSVGTGGATGTDGATGTGGGAPTVRRRRGQNGCPGRDDQAMPTSFGFRYGCAASGCRVGQEAPGRPPARSTAKRPPQPGQATSTPVCPCWLIRR